VVDGPLDLAKTRGLESLRSHLYGPRNGWATRAGVSRRRAGLLRLVVRGPSETCEWWTWRVVPPAGQEWSGYAETREGAMRRATRAARGTWSVEWVADDRLAHARWVGARRTFCGASTDPGAVGIARCKKCSLAVARVERRQAEAGLTDSAAPDYGSTPVAQTDEVA
jgi:hypothetical protein